SRVGLDRGRSKSVRCRISIGIESGVIQAASAWPKAGRRNFPIISFLRHIVGQSWNSSAVKRRAASGKTSDGDVEAAPEQMDRAAFSEKRCPECLEHPVDRHQRLMKPLDSIVIVRTVEIILVERHWVRDFIRLLIEARCAAQLSDKVDKIAVKFRNRHRS